MKVIAEYLWLDGNNLSADAQRKFTILDSNKNQEVRSKTKIMEVDDNIQLEQIPIGHLDMEDLKLREKKQLVQLEEFKASIWGFDGSSTNQATGSLSDCVLKPVRIYIDPILTKQRPDYLSILVLNEVYDVPGQNPHLSNMRVRLRELAERYKAEEFWFGMEQEYTLMRVDDHDFSRIARPLGFPKSERKKDDKYPEPQGKYYCGNGADKIVGRKLVQEHMFDCLDADLLIAGVNAEVMPGQWEYQKGNGTALSDPLKVADDLMVSRFLMTRRGEEYGVVPSLEPKPHPKWNGAGLHMNWSNKAMRASDEGFAEIIERLRKNHDAHIKVYGEGIERRLTGYHETSSYLDFSAGVSDRGASIRIPWQVAADRKGYMEDRRPCANINPYVAIARMMETVMEGQ